MQRAIKENPLSKNGTRIIAKHGRASPWVAGEHKVQYEYVHANSVVGSMHGLEIYTHEESRVKENCGLLDILH